jgi:transposase-like protein
LALERDELKKLLKEKGVRSLDDFNAFMREISKEVVETILEGELTDHLGYEKHDQKAKATDNARNGFTPKTVKPKYGEIGLDVPRETGNPILSPRSSRSGRRTSQGSRTRSSPCTLRG